MPTETKTSYLRNFIFGVEDSLVSTVGLISGVAVAGVSIKIVILTGIVLVFVEAFSMAVGSLLSENSAEEFKERSAVPVTRSFKDAVVMLFSYLAAGILVILPYAFAPSSLALILSVMVSLLALFALGAWSAHLSGTSKLRLGFLMSMLGGTAIVLGVVVGQLVNKLV